jgi:hypothetical protein
LGARRISSGSDTGVDGGGFRFGLSGRAGGSRLSLLGTAADLCFPLCGKSWVAGLPALKIYVLLALFELLSYLAHDPQFERQFFRLLPFLLAVLVMLKLALAQWAFRLSLKRQLLSRAAMLKYLIVWTTLAVAFLVPTLVLFHSERWNSSLALGILLMLPLARIGLCPIALSLGRHR